MDKTHVLFVTRPIALPWDEGSKKLSFDLANNLTNVNAHILTVKNVDLQVKNNVIKHPIYTSNILSFSQKIKLIKHLFFNKDAIDIYHFMFRTSLLTSKISALASNFKNVGSILTIPNIFEDIPIEKYLFGDYIVTFSNHSKKVLIEKGYRNVKRIRPGVDLSKFKPEIKMETPSDSKGEISILYGGDLFFTDIDDFVRLVKNIRKVEDNFKMIISARQRINREKKLYLKFQKRLKNENLSNYVELMGFIPNIQNFLSKIDIHIYPVRRIEAKYELPLILIETMACGKPIIVPDVKPLDELITNENGYLIPPEDVHVLEDLLIELIHNGKKRLEMGRKARESAEKEYDIRKIALEYESLYMEILNG